jgi:hypothetical protein
VDVFTADGETTLSFAVSAGDVVKYIASSGLFLFAVDLSGRNAAIGPGEWRVRWTAVRRDAAAVVMMMDAKVPAARAAGAVRFGGRGEAGVAERLPAPGCGGARLEAEVVVELVAGEERLLVEKVRLGVMRLSVRERPRRAQILAAFPLVNTWSRVSINSKPRDRSRCSKIAQQTVQCLLSSGAEDISSNCTLPSLSTE